MTPHDEIEDDNDSHWDAQQQMEAQMLNDDPGYAEHLYQVALNQLNSIQLN